MAELNPYTKSTVATATAMELVLMVYDEGIRSLDLAEAAFGIGGPESIALVGNHLRHAQDAITELSVTLDMQQGGEIAVNLHRIYDFMINHLSQANVTQSLPPVLEVRNLMIELRDTWQKVAEQEAQIEGGTQAPPGIASGRFRFAG